MAFDLIGKTVQRSCEISGGVTLSIGLVICLWLLYEYASQDRFVAARVSGCGLRARHRSTAAGRRAEQSRHYPLQAGTVRLRADDCGSIARVEPEDAGGGINLRHVMDTHRVIFALRDGFIGLERRMADG